MNKVILIGYIASEPDMQYTPSNIARCTFRLAVQRRFASGEGKEKITDFFTVIAWRQTAEVIARYTHKGSRIAVAGNIQNRTYQKDGVTHYITEIIADEVEFLQSKQEQTPQPSAPAPSQPEQMGFTQVDDDELPF